ncbi:MAG: hypothetical protein IBX64_09780 [Actinobacteria bacterium]|nr:hypothetical protein [Actinomycetota bacterium]
MIVRSFMRPIIILPLLLVTIALGIVVILLKPPPSIGSNPPEVINKSITIQGQSFGVFGQPEAVVVSGPWGKEAGQFWIVLPEGEGLAMGPGSFVVDTVGNVYILDQLNKRVRIFDSQGKFKSKFAIESAMSDYIAVDASGAIYITDFYDAREVYVYSKDGKLIDKAPISQSITAIRDVITRGNEAFVVDDWTQEVHKLATSSRTLTPVEQDKVQASGLWQGDLNSTIKLFGSQEYSTNILTQDEQGNDRIKTHISSHRRMLIDSLKVDRQGNSYLFAVVIKHTLEDGITDSQVVLLKVDRNGNYISSLRGRS